MTIVFLILGWVLWNGIAFFILKMLSKKYDECCNCEMPNKQCFVAFLCLLAMIVVSVTALLALLSVTAKED